MSSLIYSLEFGLGGVWLAEHTLRSVGAGLAIFDQDGRLSRADDRSVDLLELDVDGRSDHRFDDPRWAAIHLDGASVDVWSDPVQQALGVKSSTVTDVIGIVTNDNDRRWLAVTALPLAAADGKVQGVIASLVEVTGIVRDRAAVDLAEELGRSAFDNTSVPTCVIDEQNRLIEWNRAFARVVDRADYELLSTPLSAWLVDDSVIDDALDSSKTDPVTTGWTTGAAVRVRAWRYSGREGATMVELSEQSDAHTSGDILDDAIAGIRIDKTGRIIRANVSFGNLVGVAANKLAGNRVDLFVSGLPDDLIDRSTEGPVLPSEPQRLVCRVSRLGATDMAVDAELTAVDETAGSDVLITMVERRRRDALENASSAA